LIAGFFPPRHGEPRRRGGDLASATVRRIRLATGEAEVVKIGNVQPAEKRLPRAYRAMEEFLGRHLAPAEP
jgi:hypothetical protein